MWLNVVSRRTTDATGARGRRTGAKEYRTGRKTVPDAAGSDRGGRVPLAMTSAEPVADRSLSQVPAGQKAAQSDGGGDGEKKRPRVFIVGER